MSDTLKIYGNTYTGIDSIKAADPSGNELVYIRPQGSITITENGSVDVTAYSSATINISGGSTPTLQTKSKTYTPTESQQTESVAVDSGYDGLSAVNITVEAVSSSYVGTGITRRSSSDLTASGATISVPSGYYESSASKSVTSGTEGTPTATKGTVSKPVCLEYENLSFLSTSINITFTTPLSVGKEYHVVTTFNRPGKSRYNSVEGTFTFSDYPVIIPDGITPTVSSWMGANDDVYVYSDHITLPQSGDEDNWYQLYVEIEENTGPSIEIVPSVTNTAGYIAGGTHTGTAVTVTAAELASGSKAISSNGTGIDVVGYETVSVNVPTGTARSSSDLTVSGATVNVPAGLYSSAASKSVASGTEGTPTATKGTVSNHAVTVTPSVTNTAGYISGGTKTGTAVTVSASELVSGSATQSSNGTYDVTNLASLVVAVPIVTYYTGSSVPSSSLGSNGDIYLQTS